MRVLVAGSTGAIGRPLVRQLIGAGHAVVATTRSPARADALRATGAEPVVCDALDETSVRTAVEATHPDAIVNQLTAIPDPIRPRNLDRQFAATNQLRRYGTANLMQAARNGGVARVLSQSIAFAYAPTGAGPWTEHDRLNHDGGETVEAISALERQTLETEGVDGVVLRYGFFYGPGTTWAPAGGAARNVMSRRFPIVGHGDGVWSWIHVADAASATAAALERGSPGAYNIVDDDPAPVAEWLPLLADVLGAKPPRRVPAFVARLAAGADAVRQMTALQPASNAKAKRELGWRPRYPSWRDGFRTALG
jgi:2-alkyl-3-oxoalkanoate reductase